MKLYRQSAMLSRQLMHKGRGFVYRQWLQWRVNFVWLSGRCKTGDVTFTSDQEPLAVNSPSRTNRMDVPACIQGNVPEAKFYITFITKYCTGEWYRFYYTFSFLTSHTHTHTHTQTHTHTHTHTHIYIWDSWCLVLVVYHYTY